MAHRMCTTLAVLALTGATIAQETTPPPEPPPQFAAAMSIQNVVRFKNSGRSQLLGLGLVVGLNGTGDIGKEVVAARPLAEFHRSLGNPIERVEDLAKAKSAAVVLVTCEIPETGARTNDTFDITVSAMHTATSLKGGVLVTSALRGPIPGQPVYAYARGNLMIGDENTPTVAKVMAGGQLIKDILIPLDKRTFDLVIRPHYRSWHTADLVAGQINDITADLEEDDFANRVATAIDATTVRVEVPANETADPARFIAGIMTHKFSPSLLDLPAAIIVNERIGSIVATANVEVSNVSVTHKNLSITITNPEPVPTAADPVIETREWIPFGSTARERDRPRINDLLAAFEQLDVPTKDQIALLKQIHEIGSIHADFVIDE